MSNGFGDFLGGACYWDLPYEYKYFQFKTKQVAENKAMTIKMKPIDLTTKEAQALFGGKEKFEVASITSSNGMCIEVELVKPIPPKPQVRFEYEKVTESIWKLEQDYKDGFLYASSKGSDKYYQVNNEGWLLQAHANSNIYRRVEKVVDWRDEVKTKYKNVINSPYLMMQRNPDLFLEMCREILRATGELPPKGEL